MSYVERKINLTITLQAPASGQNPNPTFAGTNANTLKILGGGNNPAGLRISAAIVKAGGRGLTTAEVRIYGLPLSIMNQLSTLGLPILYYVGRNLITIEAGDDQSGMATLFQGVITQAWADLEGAPEAVFTVMAFVGALQTTTPTPATSYPGGADVATIMQGLASRGGFNFQNNGVQVRLANPYFWGSIMAQIQACAEAADVAYIIDDNALVIWPKNGSRGGLVPKVAPGAGLVGYPRYTSQGVAFRCEFTPSIGFGSQVELDTSITPAKGTWNIYKLTYDLECQEPDGHWFLDIEAARPGIQVIPQ